MLYTDDIAEIGRNVTAPILLSYIRWIICSCVESNISRLYFLARDGFVLKKIAEIICKRNGIEMDLRYLYCSRCSLRFPLFHLFGDEGLNQLTLSACTNTADAVFKRIGFSNLEIKSVAKKMRLNYSPKKILNKSEFKAFCGELKKCSYFLELANAKSIAAYKPTIAYFRQEGLFDDVKYALVDSGWSGSMQRSIRQLLDSAGCRKNLIGFYFGMFTNPMSKSDGEYRTFYFNSASSVWDKIKFSNNLFECMLSAGHAMTIGYVEKGNKVEPVFGKEPSVEQKALISAHQQGILSYVYTAEVGEKYDKSREIKAVRRMVRRVAAYPSAHEAEVYGWLMFSDDVSEQNAQPLASRELTANLNEYTVIRRIFRRFFGKNSDFRSANLFWVYGTIAFLPRWKQWWYRVNFFAWEWCRYLLVRVRLH